MKRKLTFLAILLTLGLVLVPPQSAQVNTWVLTSITQVGQDLNSSIVALTHVAATPVFKNKQFRLNPENKKEMLAVALTAVSMGKNVFILLNEDGFTIDRIRLKNY